MAGYMTKQHGNLYHGEMTNGTAAAVKNGQLLLQGTSTNAGKLVGVSAGDSTTKLLLVEKTTIYDGIEAYRFIVNALGAAYYFVENGFERETSLVYDNTEYTTPVGKYLRAHPLVVGDEFITTIVDGTMTVGTEYGVTSAGKIGTVSAG